MMVMWILLTAYTLFRWGENPTWKWTVLSGVFGGLAILTKVVAAFPVLAVLLAIALATRGLREDAERCKGLGHDRSDRYSSRRSIIY